MSGNVGSGLLSWSAASLAALVTFSGRVSRSPLREVKTDIRPDMWMPGIVMKLLPDDEDLYKEKIKRQFQQWIRNIRLSCRYKSSKNSPLRRFVGVSGCTRFGWGFCGMQLEQVFLGFSQQFLFGGKLSLYITQVLLQFGYLGRLITARWLKCQKTSLSFSNQTGQLVIRHISQFLP